jgi:hypothetical protein
MGKGCPQRGLFGGLNRLNKLSASARFISVGAVGLPQSTTAKEKFTDEHLHHADLNTPSMRCSKIKKR